MKLKIWMIISCLLLVIIIFGTIYTMYFRLMMTLFAIGAAILAVTTVIYVFIPILKFLRIIPKKET